MPSGKSTRICFFRRSISRQMDSANGTSYFFPSGRRTFSSTPPPPSYASIVSPRSRPSLSTRCRPTRSWRKNSFLSRRRAFSSGISMVHCRSASTSVIPANFNSARSPCARADSIVASRVWDSSGETRMTFDRCWKRSKESVQGSTLTSPRIPCGLRMTPSAMRLVKNIEDVAPSRFLSGGIQESSHCPRRAALTDDDFAEVELGDLELDDRCLIAFVRPDSYRVGIVDELFGDEFDELFHLNFLRSDLTVGDSCAP